jgi:hypothetical protein
MESWRERARPIILKVLADNDDKTFTEISAALRQAYPFGNTDHWPYKIWCRERKYQLDLRELRKRIEKKKEKPIEI